MRKRAGVALLAAALLSGCSSSLAWQAPSSVSSGSSAESAGSANSSTPTSTGKAGAVSPAGSLNSARHLVGVYEQDLPVGWSGVSKFSSTTGITPKMVLYYSSWKESFKASFADMARSHDAYVLVQMQPNNVTMASIAAGDSDSYLRSYAAAVREFGHPVIISFGHEMNGNWYAWGAGHTKPSAFVAAWRHIVDVFREAGASNVTWVWAVNSTNTADSLSPWWPGSKYVNWVGIDGYYYRSTDSFGSVFGQTISQIRQFSSAPVVIAETAVGITPDRETQIKDLLAGIQEDNMVGFVWFDTAQHNGIYHQDWRLEDDSAALDEYKVAVQRYLGQ